MAAGSDQAQSFVGVEYGPRDADWVRTVNWNGRITQDIRSVMQPQDVSTGDKRGTQLFRSRLTYRNAPSLAKVFA